MRVLFSLLMMLVLLPELKAQPELNKRVRITDAGELYSTFDLDGSEARPALKRLFGQKYQDLSDHITEEGWPSGLKTLNGRQKNRSAIESFAAYEVYRSGQFVFLVIPASENSKQPASVRSSEDFYMVFNEPGIEPYTEESGFQTPTPGGSGSITGTPVKLLGTGGLRSTYNLAGDEQAGNLRRQLGDAYTEVLTYSQETMWPSGIASLTALDKVREQMLKYKAWKVAEWGTVYILKLPAYENKHMPSNMRPEHDIYFVIDAKDVKVTGN